MVIQKEITAFLGLGGNLGEPFAAFQRARKFLADHPLITAIQSSPVYQTPPIGGPAGQPDYLNAVLMITTSLRPQDLLTLCQTLEKSAGRVRRERWGARTLDIDLLLYDDQITSDRDIQIPHPRMKDRHFVLLPLVDLAPEFSHPESGLSMRELLNLLPPATDIRVLHQNW